MVPLTASPEQTAAGGPGCSQPDTRDAKADATGVHVGAATGSKADEAGEMRGGDDEAGTSWISSTRPII